MRTLHNLEWAQWRNYFEDEPYQITCPDLPGAPGFRDQGRQLIDDGKTDEAGRMLKELNAADPSLQLDSEQEITKWIAPKRLAESERLRKDDKIAEAVAAFNEVEQMDASNITAG